MEFRPRLNKQPNRLVGGHLVTDDGFSVEKVAKETLEMTRMFGNKREGGGMVKLVSPYKATDGQYPSLNVYPSEALEVLIRRINEMLRQCPEFRQDVAPSRYRAGGSTYPPPLFGR